MRKTLLVLFLLGISASVSGQTVITNTYTTLGSCGTPHSGVPIILCANAGTSFVLGSNIPYSTTDAIDITGDGITLDLSGYAIKGPNPACTANPPFPGGNSCTAGSGGIGINVSGRHVTIKNGSVEYGSSVGIQGTALGPNGDLVLKDLSIHDNRGTGVSATNNVKIVDVQVSNNVGDGIFMQSGLVRSSSAFNNNGRGFELTVSGGTLIDSVAQYNSGDGVFLVGGGIASGVSSIANGAFGFDDQGGMIINSNANGNALDGVWTSTGLGAGSVWNTTSGSNVGFGFNLSPTSCYTTVTTNSNTGGTLTGGTAMGSSSVCAH